MSEFRGVRINPELPAVLIISILLILGGIAVLVFAGGQSFNFYSSKITINGVHVQEELHFKPNKEYHTLFRNFVSPVYSNYLLDIGKNNYIGIENVECSAGNSYFKNYAGQCYSSEGQITSCYVYTENDEYGCTFGDTLGFLKGKEYTINSEYEVHPENIFKIKNNYYVKFVVYSPNNHIKLTNKNFIVEGNVVKNDKYFSNENVVLYIPYSGSIIGFNIIDNEDFEFDSQFGFLPILFAIIPGILFFLIWLFIGKERSYEDVPKELSTFPTKRKFWEVAAYFNPPFFVINKNVFACIILNFYNKKIIDIKEKDKDIYIKLNKFNGDEIEKKIYDILEFIWLNMRRGKDKEYIDGDYFNLKGFMKSFYYQYSVSKMLSDKFKELREDVKEKGKEYLESTAMYMKIIIGCAIFFLFILLSYISSIISDKIYLVYVSAFILTVILSFNSAIFFRFKGNYYIEYQKWQALKRYLNNSFSIKTATHKTVVIWNEYLVYATALGVPQRVIKELRASNLIDEKQMNIYNGVILTSSFASSSGGGAGGGGGFGGAGGGGAGGGGGGGR